MLDIQIKEKPHNTKATLYLSAALVVFMLLLILIFKIFFSDEPSENLTLFSSTYLLVALININTFRNSTKRKEISFELPNKEAYEHFLAYLKRRYDLKEENSDQSSFLFQFRNPFYRLFSNWAHHREVHMHKNGKSIIVNAAKLEADYIESFLLYNEDMKKLTA